MSLLAVNLSPASVNQNGPITGRVTFDTEAGPLRNATVRFLIPPHTFANVQFARGAGIASSDAFDPVLSDPAFGEYIVTVTFASSAAALEVGSFTATVVGPRGSRPVILADLVSAVDAADLPLVAARVTADVLVNAGAPGLLVPALSRAELNDPYSSLIAIQGGQPPYTVSQLSGSLPAGLVLGAGGLVSGLPSAIGTSTARVRIDDSASAPQTVDVDLAVQVVEAPLRVTTATLPSAAAGYSYMATLQHGGGTAPVRWEVEGLPAGLFSSGSSIRGSVDADRATVGSHAVTLRVIDQLQPPRIAERIVELLVLPAKAVVTFNAAHPRAVATAHDLFVADWDIEFSASGEAGRTDPELERALEEYEEDLITQIADMVMEDWGFDPTDPGGSGTPDPTERAERRDELGILLDEYKHVRDAQRGAKVVLVGADVYIDDVLVARVNQGPRTKSTEQWQRRYDLTRRPKQRSIQQRRTLQQIKDSFKNDRARTVTLFETALLERLDARRELQHRSEGRGDSATPRPIAFGGTPSREWEGALVTSAQMFADALHQLDVDLSDLIPEFDLDLDFRLQLTTGPHRVRIHWAVGVAVSPGSLVGALERAGTTASYHLKLTPRNPDDWPRLRDSLEIRGSGAASGTVEHDVLLPHTGVDIAACVGNEIRLWAATGDPDDPYKSAERLGDLSSSISGPLRMAAGPADAVGRSAVTAASSGMIACMLNRGPGGFTAVECAIPAGDVPPRATFVQTSDEIRSVVVLVRNLDAVVVRGFTGTAALGPPDPTPSTATTMLTPNPRSDKASSIVRNPDNASAALVSHFLFGTVDVYDVSTAGVSRTGPLSGTVSSAPRALTDLLVGSPFAGDLSLVAVDQRSDRLMEWRQIAAGGAFQEVGGPWLPFAAAELCAGAGVQGGVLARSEIGGLTVLVWRRDQATAAVVLPYDLGGGISGMASTGDVLVIAREGLTQNAISVHVTRL